VLTVRLPVAVGLTVIMRVTCCPTASAPKMQETVLPAIEQPDEAETRLTSLGKLSDNWTPVEATEPLLVMVAV